MAFDEDAVKEAEARVKAFYDPIIEALVARLDALEANGGAGAYEPVKYTIEFADGKAPAIFEKV